MSVTDLRQALSSANVQAFLHVVRAGESGSTEEAYRALYGWRPGNGKVFTSFRDHPRQAFLSPWGWTSAAGAYQAMCEVPSKVKTDTWGDFIRACGPQDFSPASQDLFAVWCINRRKALPDVLAGRLPEAIEKCNREWASLPGSPYGQPTRTLAQAQATYLKYGGALYALPQPAQTTTEPTPTKPEARMPLPAIIGALLPSLIQAVPTLSKLFGSGTEVAERNVKAAELAMTVAQDAIGATNAQEAVEKAKSDPAAAQAITQAIEARWLELTEAGGDGIAGARRANAEYGLQGGPRFWFNPAFWVSMVLLAMPMMLLIDVFYVHPAAYVGEIRTQIVTGVLLVIGMVGGYWIGTSFSSARKDERQAPPAA